MTETANAAKDALEDFLQCICNCKPSTSATILTALETIAKEQVGAFISTDGMGTKLVNEAPYRPASVPDMSVFAAMISKLPSDDETSEQIKRVRNMIASVPDGFVTDVEIALGLSKCYMEEVINHIENERFKEDLAEQCRKNLGIIKTINAARKEGEE